ncbi:histone acetyltransferase [Ascoidea rubescens DSM 1968]|uniref:histone acetyltransferase n=1 Tax=Ascoidea rubescens DSM 1968 TaxID=1344418 RepID=A0A1D2VN35_9ASCO|nr:histone acetyltransferase catalytic subunit of the SAS complex (Sas2p-Sas4p-Sas5p) [Ascoidea rubescens DSM 1968]ODV62994.1 histone acetyltransferase catalytic subunit of the SAS complex (Sas2p-Sas4p-Sas5p) [Ascoidea rubescens DSM 1968]
MPQKETEEEEEDLYGVLHHRNIKEVVFGELQFDTWYGCSMYFAKDKKTLGYKYSQPSNGSVKTGKKKDGSSGISSSNPPSDDIFAEEEEDVEVVDSSFNTSETEDHPKGTLNGVNGKSDSFWLNTLYVCDYCFKYTDEHEALKKHCEYCLYRERFPGKIKYKDDVKNFTIRKVRGSRHTLFCQCLSLFGKLFLDTKSIFFHVENFEFYVVYGKVEDGLKPMGFFSKELLSWEENNLACICVFPPYQRHKLGTLLISFSYELSKFQGLITGPELPLSSFGKIGYLKYWSSVLVYELLRGRFSGIDEVTIDELSRFTGIRADDILTTLQYLKCLVRKENKRLFIMKGNIAKWAKEKNFKFESVLNKDNLILE